MHGLIWIGICTYHISTAHLIGRSLTQNGCNRGWGERSELSDLVTHLVTWRAVQGPKFTWTEDLCRLNFYLQLHCPTSGVKKRFNIQMCTHIQACICSTSFRWGSDISYSPAALVIPPFKKFVIYLTPVLLVISCFWMIFFALPSAPLEHPSKYTASTA